MPIQLIDQVLLDEASMRETRDGYLVANARSARTGIQTYRARELGLTDRNPDDMVRVYRPPEEVFAGDAMTSMAHRPITMDHPREMVTADNWKRYARGATGEEVVRDGDFVRVPLVLMDKAAIEDVRSGKRELSWGYTCEVELIDGTTPDGERYDAIQRGIRANHLAVCSVARGGPELRICDERRETSNPNDGGKAVPTKTITFDGLPVEVTNAAEAVINKLKGLLDAATAAKTAAETQVGTLTATVQAKDGEIAALQANALVPDETVQLWLDRAARQVTTDWTDMPVRAQLDATTEAMRRAAGYTDTDQRILVLAAGVAPITTDDEITVLGQRWAIASVSQDPAASYCELREQRA